MPRQKYYFQNKIFLSLLLVSMSQPAWSNAFKSLEQSVTTLGTGFSGTAALAEDASTNYYNSAGLTRLCDEQIVLGGIALLPNTTLNVTNATSTFGTPLSPNTGKTRAIDNAVLPLLHYAKRIGDSRWVFGFSAVIPFGAKENYQINSLARYIETRGEMKTFDLAPSLAYQFNNGLSLGAGIDAIYTLFRLDSRIGRGNLTTDGFTTNTLTNVNLGYHVGGLYEITDCTRFGVQYHSQVNAKTKGESLTQLGAGLPVVRQGVKSDINFPAFLVLSTYHAFDEQWSIMADLEWVRWKHFKQLILRYDNNAQLIFNENYKNAYRIGAGGSYQYNEPWRFKVGIMFDKSPVPDASRNIFVPNQDNIAPTIGAQYRVSKTLAVDFGYTHVFSKKDNNINEFAPISVGTFQGLQNLQGNIKHRPDVFGLQMTWDIEP